MFHRSRPPTYTSFQDSEKTIFAQEKFMKFLSRLWIKLSEKGITPHLFAWSGAIGIFLAFSPFLGIQTILVFVFAFLLRAKSSIIFTILYTINNPWTMIPIAVADYVFGSWLTNSVLGINLTAYDPQWVNWLNDKLCPYISPYLGITHLCFWCYLIGGMIIATIAAVCSYPLFKKFAEKQEAQSIKLKKQN